MEKGETADAKDVLANTPQYVRLRRDAASLAAATISPHCPHYIPSNNYIQPLCLILTLPTITSAAHSLLLFFPVSHEHTPTGTSQFLFNACSRDVRLLWSCGGFVALTELSGLSCSRRIPTPLGHSLNNCHATLSLTTRFRHWIVWFTNNRTCGDTWVEKNMHHSKHVLESSGKQGRTRTDPSTTLPNAVWSSVLVSLEIHLDAGNNLLEAFSINNALLSLRPDVSFVFCRRHSCVNALNLPVIAVLFPAPSTTNHVVAWRLSKNERHKRSLVFSRSSSASSQPSTPSCATHISPRDSGSHLSLVEASTPSTVASTSEEISKRTWGQLDAGLKFLEDVVHADEGNRGAVWRNVQQAPHVQTNCFHVPLSQHARLIPSLKSTVF